MRVLHSLEAWSAGPPAVVTVGNFDGVHLAHQQLLRAVRDEAARERAQSVIVSFDPHPARILSPQSAPPLITPGEEKIRQLRASGVDALLLLPFSRDLSLLGPLEFVEQVLVRGLRASSVHEGDNFRFGHRHQGTVADLARWGAEFHFALHLHGQLEVEGEVVSSSRIRALVAAGEVGRARRLLGRPFAVRGLVAPGRGVGRQRTVPTLNLQHYEELLPGRGVYLTTVQLGLQPEEANPRAQFAALTNVGLRPTFGEGAPLTVESHLLLHPQHMITAAPGDTIEIAFLARLRDERRFATPEALREQIQRDIAVARRYFGRYRK